MNNYSGSGHRVNVTAPYALASGDGCLVGSLFGVALQTYANGAPAALATEGEVTLKALSTDVGTQGLKCYWDNTNKRVTVTAAGNTLIGVLLSPKANGETTALVYLDGAIR